MFEMVQASLNENNGIQLNQIFYFYILQKSPKKNLKCLDEGK